LPEVFVIRVLVVFNDAAIILNFLNGKFPCLCDGELQIFALIWMFIDYILNKLVKFIFGQWILFKIKFNDWLLDFIDKKLFNRMERLRAKP
jgi:hypothetical protein